MNTFEFIKKKNLEEKKLSRMEYLGEMIIKYQTTEPRLTEEDIAIVLVEQVADLTEFLKFYKKHNKQNTT